MGFLPLISSDHAVTFVYTGLAAASTIHGREVGRCTHTHPWVILLLSESPNGLIVINQVCK